MFILDEDRSKQLKTCFKILDLDRDNKLNIINLLHLYKNIPLNTALGQEIFKVLKVFLEKNLYSKSVLTRIEINAESYLKILNNKTCINYEIRNKFLGIQGSLKEMAENGSLA